MPYQIEHDHGGVQKIAILGNCPTRKLPSFNVVGVENCLPCPSLYTWENIL